MRKLKSKILNSERIKQSIKEHNVDITVLTSNIDELLLSDKIEFKCNIHNEVYIKEIKQIILGFHCNSCLLEKSRKNLQIKFIEKAKKLHGGKYDYSEVYYKKSENSKVKIFCKKCNDYFYQSPNQHLKTQGCQKCAWKKNGQDKANNTDTIKNKLIEKHGDKFEYDFTEYKGTHSKISIYCKKHDKWYYQSFWEHYKGYGCPDCALELKAIKRRKNIPIILSIQELIDYCNKLYNNNFDYSEISSYKLKDSIDIVCKKHNHKFTQNVSNHLKGLIGCKFCQFSIEKLTEQEVNNRLKVKFDGSMSIVNYGYYADGLRVTKFKCDKCNETFDYKLEKLLSLKTNTCPKCRQQLINTGNIKVKSFIKKGITDLKKYCNLKNIDLSHKDFNSDVKQFDYFLNSYVVKNNIEIKPELYGIIYKITNEINGKVYIGKTIKKLRSRLREHLIEAKKVNSMEDIKKARLLYLALNKYGFNNFKCEVVDIAYSSNDLHRKERFHIKKENSLFYIEGSKGYNMV